MCDSSSTECDRLISHIEKSTIGLTEAALGPSSYWASLPLCVVDSVFSIGVKYYPGVENVVVRWCESQSPRWEQESRSKPTSDVGPTVTEFIEIINRRLDGGCTYENLFHNKWRTSSRNGILKAEAVHLFAKELLACGINRFTDVRDHKKLAVAEKRLKGIPGQRSGLSFKYFQMLIGEEDYVKSDRHVRRFVSDALCIDWSRLVSPERAEELAKEAAYKLKNDYPGLTPARLDLAIWNYQHTLTKPSPSCSD